jgi:23S rRNA (guanosine2251-2'-O)-methyltransferase
MAIPLLVCLDNVRSAYNVGSVFRTADSANVNELILCGFTPCPPHPKLDKTALGSITTVLWNHQCDCTKAVMNLKRQGYQILVFETAPSATSLFQAHFTKPTVMVFGNEVNGVNPSVCAAADLVIAIPHFGAKESLNIAIAAGIGIYEFRRQNPL